MADSRARLPFQCPSYSWEVKQRQCRQSSRKEPSYLQGKCSLDASSTGRQGLQPPTGPPRDSAAHARRGGPGKPSRQSIGSPGPTQRGVSACALCCLLMSHAVYSFSRGGQLTSRAWRFMAKDGTRDVPPHWGPLKVNVYDLSLRWGTLPLAAEGLSHPAPTFLPTRADTSPMARDLKRVSLEAGNAAGCGPGVEDVWTHQSG